jgi:hypothetical protein
MSVVMLNVALRSNELMVNVALRSNELGKPKNANGQRQRSGAMKISLSDLCMRRQLAIESDIASAPRMQRSV